MKTKLLQSKWRPLLLCLMLLAMYDAEAQVAAVIRYQQNIQGGATLIGNSWFYTTTPTGTRTISDIDEDASTTRSSSADLILPAGSTIVKAYLSIEKGSNGTNFTSVKLKAPGASAYTTLAAATSLADRKISSYNQMIWDITNMISPTGYVSVAGGGAGGRYTLADPTPGPSDMGGWSIIVVYSNPNSKFRNVTVADNWQHFNGNSVTTNITGVKVPGSGTITAVVGVTGTYGDRGYTDLLNFGVTGGTLAALADPMTGVTNDALNSSIAWVANNNVSVDGGPAISGNYTARNPISTGHFYGAAESWDFDADIFDATGKLTASPNPVSVTLEQKSTGGDVLVSGSYFISVDAAIAPKLTKSISPATIIDGGTATYTWTITNTEADAVLQAGISFTDFLPSNIKVAATPNATITGGTGGNITAAAGSNTVNVFGLSLAPGQTATIAVDVTNVPGELNPSCSTDRPAFTNGISNIIIPAEVFLNASTMTPQCLVVNSQVTGTIDCSKTQLYTAPVENTPGQKDLVVTIDVTNPGCFTPVTLSGSGITLANPAIQLCTTTTGIQQFHIPVNYDGSALGTLSFTVNGAGSCTADLTKPPKKAIADVWTLECLPTAGPVLVK